MDVYDERWVTNFEEKIAEMSGSNSSDKKAGEFYKILTTYIYCIYIKYIRFSK